MPIAPVRARIYGYVAREADIAVLLRRGPTKWVEMLTWNLATDEVIRGQWFRGRVYERDSDLSPDGKLFVYCAFYIGRGEGPYARGAYAWTALSQPPYFTPLAIWHQPAPGCGSGDFVSNTELRLSCEHGSAVPSEGNTGAITIQADYSRPTLDNYAFFRALLRDGWRRIHSKSGSELNGLLDSTVYAEPDLLHSAGVAASPIPQRNGYARELYEKTSPSGSLLRELTDYDSRSRYSCTFSGSAAPDLSTAGWADWDHAGRLLFSQGGCLWYAIPGTDSLAQPVMIADLNPHQPTRVDAPAWARS